jgi:hypothetical protein
VIVPVAAEGETVAVNRTLAPVTGVLVEAVSVVVLAVVPLEPLGACQKSPHPASKTAAAQDNRIGTVRLRIGMYSTLHPLRTIRKDG